MQPLKSGVRDYEKQRSFFGLISDHNRMLKNVGLDQSNPVKLPMWHWTKSMFPHVLASNLNKSSFQDLNLTFM